ncbi:hypothetical protein EDB82DRAFT_484911 [Fusarium venenatum]|uniref:uncharacterized protein n=1 Tax=Fusarium venenatum TaxID=56646 RepID=UPI001E17992B|nr:hypothetical protein EDB82DRAFT_484911 [Fusarium venenatum]
MIISFVNRLRIMLLLVLGYSAGNHCAVTGPSLPHRCSEWLVDSIYVHHLPVRIRAPKTLASNGDALKVVLDIVRPVFLPVA